MTCFRSLFSLSQSSANILKQISKPLLKPPLRQNEFGVFPAVVSHTFAQRFYSSNPNSKSLPVAATGTAASKQEARDFMAVFPDVVRDLTEIGKNSDMADAAKWLGKVLQYNVPGGKKNRGLAVVISYKILLNKDTLTDEELKLVQVMGWCVEMFQAYFLIMDDIMDGSLTRRGRQCWYRTNNLGVKAINDAIMLESGIYKILHKYFKQQPYYLPVLDLYHDTNFKTTIGQCLDLQSYHESDRPNYNKFTMDRYNAIVKYKTAYYSFHMPVAIAMLMAGNNDIEMHRQAKTILLEMGHFFQIQDDYLDCFGDPEVTGKIGTDIEDGKCSWLAVVALQRVNTRQRTLFEECYGNKDIEKVKAIKNLYVELGIPATYQTYEEESYNIISTHIQQISRGLPHKLFFTFMNKIYKRDN